jgi:hypothetical protein
MSSGWGCQHLTKFKDEKEWCRLLKHKCDPNCKGCILHGRFLFSEPNISSDRVTKKRGER